MKYSLLEKYKIKFISDIVGQSHNVSFLQNSLFKGIFHPVYIFAGMRGTGKTTSARLFSYGMQCEQISLFQKDFSQYKNPCYECHSCILHSKNQHPDIVELDAASHTGVDTIRAIIDNVYMLPLMSKKKIYIIDEAHMLSKAAFNACLKVMEEPPVNVHFILATTELHKIIETVRSRSIILYYNPIEYSILQRYLEKICIQENILYENDALLMIVKIAEGSIRDALNIINKLVMMYEKITKEIVSKESGLLNNESITLLLDSMITNNGAVYNIQKKNIMQKRDLNKKQFFEDVVVELQKKITHHAHDDLSKKIYYKLLDLFYQYEENFYFSYSFYGLLDIIFFKCHQSAEPRKNFFSDGKSTNNEDNNTQSETKKNIDNNNDEEKIKKNELKCRPSYMNVSSENIPDKDQIALQEVSAKEKFFALLDKIIKTIFQQGQCAISIETMTVVMNFKKNFTFYNNYFLQQHSMIIQALHKSFGPQWKIAYEFNLQETIGMEILQNKKVTEMQQRPSLLNQQKVQNAQFLSAYSNIQKANEQEMQDKKKFLLVKDIPDLIVKINEIMPGKTYIHN